MKDWLSLRARLVIIVIAAVLPLFAVALYSAYRGTAEAVDTATRNLQFAASLAAASQDRLAESARQLLTAVADAPGLRDARSNVCRDYLQRLRGRFSGYDLIGVADADGVIRCQSGATPVDGPAFERAQLAEIMGRREFTAHGYVAGSTPSSGVLMFSLPLRDSGGHASGAVFAALSLTEVADTLDARPLPAGARLTILDRRGIVLAAIPPGSLKVGVPVSEPALVQAAAAAQSGVRQATDASGHERIHAFAAAAGTSHANVLASVSVDRDRVVEPTLERLRLELLVLLLGALLGTAVGWLIGGRAIVDPMRQILEATRRMRKGDLDVRLPVRRSLGGDEYGGIAAGFNLMAESLQQRQNDLSNELDRSRHAYATLELVLNSMEEGLIAVDRVGRYILFNKASANMFPRAEPIGRQAETRPQRMGLFKPGTNTLYRADELPLHRALQGESSDEFELLVRNDLVPNGRLVHGSYRPILAGEEIIGGLAVFSDVTSRQLAVDALRESEARFRTLFNGAAIGISMTDANGCFLKANPAYCAMMGYSEEELLGMDIRGVIYREDWPLSRELNLDLLSGARENFMNEKRYVRKDGRIIWGRASVSAVLRAPGGGATSVVAVTEDITAQRESQEQLRLLEASVSRLNDIVLITETDPIDEPGPRIVYVNDAFERRTGYRRDEVLGRSPRFLQGPGTQRAELDRVRAALERREPVRAELLNYGKDGRELWLDIDIVPLADAAGVLTHFVAVERDITARKLAEQALIDSERRYAALFDSAPVPMWVFDAQTMRFLTVNDAAVESYGYTREEFLSMTPLDIRPQLEQRRFLEYRAAGLQDGAGKWVHLRKGGIEFPVVAISRVVRYAGQPAHFVIAMDISAQVRAEKEVEEYLFTLQRSADAAQVIVQHQTLDGTLREAAEQARSVIRAHQSMVSLVEDRDWAHSQSVASLSDKYASYRGHEPLLDGQGIHAMVCETNRPARLTQEELESHPRWQPCGTALPMRGWLAVPLVGRDGRNIGLLQLSDKFEGEFTLQDEYVAVEMAQLASIAIENAKLFDQIQRMNQGLEQTVDERTRALERQEALFRALAEQAPQVVWTTDATGEHLTFLNRAWYELVGGTPQDWIGRSGIGAIHPEDREATSRNWLRSRREGAPFTGVRRVRARDGSYHAMSYRALPVRDANGEIGFWVGIDADISELKAVEAALRQSNHELEAFSYSVSHDLRSPLNTVHGFSRLLARQLGTRMDDKTRHYVERIQAGVGQMGQLIDGLLSLAQVSRTQLRQERVDLSALAHEIMEALRTHEPARRATVVIEDRLAVLGDSRLIRVVMENLLGNAWKFTSRVAQARIEVGCRHDMEAEPVFFVRDNGTGFDMAYADKLFVTFQRLHAVTDFPGTGIGLATASRVIHRHGGRVWAEAAPDHGATFYFTLPQVHQSAPALLVPA